MNDFEYDCKCKKDIARSAHNHVNARRGKCKLPHEYLTRKELNKLNGEVKSYNLKAPMAWATFKTMPDDLKKEYIRWLQQEFRANDHMIGELFGVVANTVTYLRKSLGIPSLGRGRTAAATEEDKVKWYHWLPGEWDDELVLETEDTDSHVADAPRNDTEEAVAPPTGVLHFRVSFGGVQSWEELYALAKQFPFPEHQATIDLEVW